MLLDLFGSDLVPGAQRNAMHTITGPGAAPVAAADPAPEPRVLFETGPESFPLSSK